MRRLPLVAAGLGLSLAACSLIVQFEPEGQACGPAGECLAGYTCVAGACTRGDAGSGCTGVVCNSPGPCQEPNGTCNPSTGRCVYPPRAANTQCSDNDQCTQGERCDGDGGCAPLTVTRCDSPPDRCRADAGTCNPATGACDYPIIPAGSACDDGNPCTVGERCDAARTCAGGSARLCNQPPSACAALVGSCDPQRGCVYPPAAGVTSCSDNSACTQGDYCDAGSCVSGPSCPPPLPCQVGTCQADGGCTYAVAPDGTSCGALASRRCCSGNCIDISSNPSHCGGCGIACTLGTTCESVAATNQCTLAPANTTARCSCVAGPSNTCPLGQSCFSLTDGGRCSPTDAGHCAAGERLQALTACPNYCVY